MPKIILEELNKKGESKKESEELVKKIPELENKNYKMDIDKDMSVEEKLKNWRIKQKDHNGVVYLRKDLNPEEKDFDKKAYVWEYFEGVFDEYKGEQQLNRVAVVKLWLVDKLPKNYEEFEKIIFNKNNYEKFIHKYFPNNDESMLKAWNIHTKKLGLFRDRVHCWLWDNDNVIIARHRIFHDYSRHPHFGFSVRLLKSA